MGYESAVNFKTKVAGSIIGVRKWMTRVSRRHWANYDLSTKRHNSVPLTAEQKAEILAFWGKYRNVRRDLKWFSFYNSVCEDKSRLKYYVPDDIYFAEIDAFFTDTVRAKHMDDKNLYDLFFHDVKMPLTLVRKTGGVILDRDYQVITADQAYELCARQGKVVSKKTRLSGGGKGVRFFDFDTTTREEFIDWLNKNKELNIQEVIHQHECLNRIHESSINTIRIMSLMLDDQLHILSSELRMGANGAQVDNASQGGMVVGIKEGGWLKETAYDLLGNKWKQHPQGAVFKDIRIEGFDKCLELVRRLAGRLCTVSRVISWDFAIGEDGEPILIEMNLTFGGVGTHQICNGPILGDLTEQVLARVYHKH